MYTVTISKDQARQIALDFYDVLIKDIKTTEVKKQETDSISRINSAVQLCTESRAA